MTDLARTVKKAFFKSTENVQVNFVEKKWPSPTFFFVPVIVYITEFCLTGTQVSRVGLGPGLLTL